MDWLTSLIGIPLGWIMWFFYKVIQNYGWALFAFTLFTRLLMLPTAINQQKANVKMAMLKPRQEEIQKKYAKNQQKINEELTKLYQKEGYSPMSGCLPLLIQFPIIFGLIDVVYKPLTHILRLSAEVLTKGQEIAVALGLANEKAWSTIQMGVIKGVSMDPAKFAAMDEIVPGTVAAIQELIPKLNFFGINLMEQPSWSMFGSLFSNFQPVILIPVLSGITSLLLSLISMKNTGAATEGQAGAGSMKGMMMIMPVFSAWIAFSVPAGVGLYWTFSNIVAIIQNLAMYKFYNPKEMAEKVRQEYEERQERERLERIEARKRAREGNPEDEEKALTQKELSRRKLAEARRRDAEKYGEVYQEDEDDDA